MPLCGEEDSAFLELSDLRTGEAIGPVKYRLHCSMAGRDLVAIGTAKVSVRAECGRCLKLMKAELEAKSVCHHYEDVAEKEVDISSDIREDILVALPTTFLCSKGCKGLCSQCGADLNEGPCECKPETDGEEPTAWGALDKLDI